MSGQEMPIAAPIQPPRLLAQRQLTPQALD